MKTTARQAVDLRTDVLSPPTGQMFEAMKMAQLGWATFSDDETLTQLEASGAQLLDKEASALLPSCTAANIAALCALGATGRSAVVDGRSHAMRSEEGGISSLAGLEVHAVDGEHGVPPLDVVEQVIGGSRGSSPLALVWLENSFGAEAGRAVEPESYSAVCELAHTAGGVVHLDGARLFNAAVALGRDAKDLVANVDSVSVSLSKGLCAPLGALLAGPKPLIEEARRYGRMFGSARIHKLGMFAAAALVALKDMPNQLHEDHIRAAHFARQLADQKIEEFGPSLLDVSTNMVVLDLSACSFTARSLIESLALRNVFAWPLSDSSIRFVFHRGVRDEKLISEAACTVLEEVSALAK